MSTPNKRDALLFAHVTGGQVSGGEGGHAPSLDFTRKRQSITVGIPIFLDHAWLVISL